MKNIKNFTFLFSTFGMIQSSYAFDLPQAWKAARNHSAEYRAYEYNRDAEIEREKQAKASLLPQVSVNGSYSYQPPSLSSTKTTRTYNIQASQTLYDGTKWSQYRQSKIGTHAAETQLRAHHDETMLKVSESYFNVLLAKDTMQAVATEREAYRQQMQQAQEMYNRGAATAVDIHEAQAGYDSAVAKEIDAMTQKQIAENQLADFTGYDAAEIAPINMENLIQRIEPQVKQNTLAQWQQLALQNNQEYQTQKLNTDMANEGVNMARANRLPKLGLNVGYQNSVYHGSQASRDYEYTGKGFSASLQISVPLFTGGEIRSKIREAAARSGEAEAKQLAVERKVKLVVKQAFTENNATRYQILAQERLLESNRLKLKSTRIGKEFGIRSNVEVIQAQKELAEAEQKLAQARYRYLQSFLILMKESGMSLDNAWHTAFPTVQAQAVASNISAFPKPSKRVIAKNKKKKQKTRRWQNHRS